MVQAGKWMRNCRESGVEVIQHHGNDRNQSQRLRNVVVIDLVVIVMETCLLVLDVWMK